MVTWHCSITNDTTNSKAKEAFKAYYVDKYQEGVFRQYDWFKDLPEAFRWGVYQDWADSLGYELYISKEHPLEYFWSLCDLLRSFNEGLVKPVKKHVTQRLRS
jgi:hypothetical protein